MKVMQLLPELNSGGVERGTLEIARALVAQGHQSLVVSNGGRLVSQLEAEGSTHLTLPIHKKSLSSLWQIRPLRQLIEEYQPDIVHVRSRVPAWLTHFALRKIPANKRPHLISTVHGFYSVNRYSAIMTQAEKVIAVSDSVVKYITDHYKNCPPQDIVRIYRGIDPAAFPHNYQPSAQWFNQVFNDFPELENKFLLCLPGRITRLKGHESLIELMQQLHSQYPQLHAVVVGGADVKKQAYLSELQNTIQSKGLADKITFVGHRSDIREWLAFSDIVLSLSNQAETFGRTALEALSVGTPIIGWNRGGVAEILSHVYPQGLVEAENEKALLEIVKHHIEQPQTVAPVTMFSLKDMCDQTLELYQSVLK
ncbi:glycosyltransferase family 4 protein [Acinetobacter baumannii]|uniref:glycosyltransferase family 4 protein n=1 Tax=Acinetobacter TaxID=469 RepID=UPI00026E1BA6|nr:MULTISPECIES: glycosyltransferase family 4 protein [Acinetobacter]AVF07252.1 glycosyl transferase [Acinetobacter baumannii]AYX98175.1 glycosyltransferase [Acinetobacter sp. FDAARGOS_493]EHU1228389.1 glycosyltransferase family 4 protein [Acinetobacter baumannii]EHU1230976.1 glycosyltransferase family 4 protein [Acinetobacter baumannii]EHU1232460.1 glycosyltransferase family 4 protein [Acinetobacter baumannii]